MSLSSARCLRSLAVLALAVGVSAGCRDSTRELDGGWWTDGGHDRDARPDTGPDGAPLDPCGPAVCGDSELCGGDGRGDGLDNDCDGQVDEDCLCEPMTDSMECFPGPPDRLNVGACSSGVQTCSEFGTWNPCVG